ncbi:serine/threonine-protein kinase [Fischerella sp. PCC 9605]|uniref:serine/threonine-protein kinase n=1 Tax=Fischerella sp. PCC 9605 TaxID=1173024 RepID=UPI00047D3D08|nr:serine/threonine-protein kinase [Fischerella sp. PCC 9605]
MSVYLKERYRLIKQIGKGGYCQTFLAIDEGQFPPIPCVVQKLPQQKQTLEAFVQKAQRLEELGKHPQIPTLLAYFAENLHFYLVHEFIEGKNLSTLLEEQGVFSETQIWHLLESLLPVLNFISDRNIIHCDIKPENIILRSPPPTAPPIIKGGLGGDLVLVDFGAAKLLPEYEQLIGEKNTGSPEYAAPEQTQGKPIFASDLYSLGVTCIHLLTHISSFDLFDIANNCWVWQQYLTTKISDRLSKIINKLIEKATSPRFQSADEVMQAIGIHSLLPLSPSPFPTLQWHCLHTLIGSPGALSSVNSIAISPDGQILASGHDDKTIKLWDLNTTKLICTLAGHSQAVKSVAFSPDGKTLATASDDKTIKLWNLNTFEEICTLFGHSNAVKSVVFSPDVGILASGSWDKTIKLWDVETGKEICTLTGHQLQVSAVAFSSQGKLLASASFDRTIRLWDLSPLHTEVGRKFKNCPCYSLLGHAWAVLTVAFSPDGNILATGSDDNTIKLWQVNTGQIISTLLGHSWSVLAVAFSPNGETLISGSRDNTVKLWKVSTTEEIATLTSHVDSVSAVAVNPVAQLIASGSRDKTIKLWQLVQQQVS